MRSYTIKLATLSVSEAMRSGVEVVSRERDGTTNCAELVKAMARKLRPSDEGQMVMARDDIMTCAALLDDQR